MELAESPGTSILGTKDGSARNSYRDHRTIGIQNWKLCILQGNVIGSGEELRKKEGGGKLMPKSQVKFLSFSSFMLFLKILIYMCVYKLFLLPTPPYI